MKATSRKILTMMILSALMNVGCATEYVPHETGQIHFVRSWKGHDLLEKGGRRYPMGHVSFSGEVVEAFAGNPAAEEHARTYVRRQRTAGVLAILGGTTAVVGLGALAISAGDGDSAATGAQADQRASTRITGLSIMTLGLFVCLVAGIVAGSGDPHLFDAVNIYNDDALKK